MTDSSLVADCATTDYLQLTAADAAGAAELRRSGMALGLVADGSGRPVQLLTTDGPAPLIQVDVDTPMRRMILGDITRLINRGVPAMVAVRGDRCAGLLTAEAVSGYAMAFLDVTTGTMGDAPTDIAVPGDPALAKPLMMTCAVCGAVNSVLYFVDGETPCVNGHPLQVTWS